MIKKKIMSIIMLMVLVTSSVPLKVNAASDKSLNGTTTKIQSSINKKNIPSAKVTKVIKDKQQIAIYAKEHNLQNPENIIEITVAEYELPSEQVITQQKSTEVASANLMASSVTIHAGEYYPSNISSYTYVDTANPIREDTSAVGGTYTMTINDSVAVRIGGDFEVSGEILKFKLGIDTTTTRTITSSHTQALASNEYVIAIAYPKVRQYNYDIMEKGYIWDSKVGTGYTIYPTGVSFVFIKQKVV